MVCILKGPDHVFEFVNEAHVTALGFNATGLPVRVAQPESVEVHGILDEVYQTGKTAELHEIPVTLTDRLRYFNLTYAARRDTKGEINGVMILGIEVTNEVLSRENLKNTIRAREEFLSIASHELKTPITSLKMGIQISARRLRQEPNLSEAGKEVLRELDLSNSQIAKMTKLIDDLLDVSRISLGKLSCEFEECDFNEIYKEVTERFRDQLSVENTVLKSEIETGLIGFWDRSRLEQVIVNLLSNAIKYAPGSPIECTAKRVGSALVFSLRDFGPGIPAKQREKIFDRFERIGVSRNISGLGLGLYISRQIISQHHGTIELEPTVTEGACFVITVPMDARIEHS